MKESEKRQADERRNKQANRHDEEIKVPPGYPKNHRKRPKDQ